MQEIKRIYFTDGVVKDLYSQHTKAVFSDTVRMLLKGRLLTPEEGMIITRALKHSKEMQSLLSRSYVIYLCNGMLDAKDHAQIRRLKSQLLLELCVRMLSLGTEAKMPCKIDGIDFSIELNQEVPSVIDVVEKKDDSFIFSREGTVLASISKNRDSAITLDIFFLDKDRNPYNVNNDHPDQVFVAYDLGTKEKKEWVRQFKAAYKLVLEKTPQIYAEIYGFLDAVVPHGYAPHKQFSSSYSRSPGILYLSYTDEDETQAEALIHEIHHTIFNIIDWKYPLLENDMTLQFYSAYRPDARHMRGCLLGLHAFVAVQHFYRILAMQDRNPMHLDHFLSFYLKNAKVIEVVEKYAKLTEHGKLLFEDIKIKFARDLCFLEEIKLTNAERFNGINHRVEQHLKDAISQNKVLLY